MDLSQADLLQIEEIAALPNISDTDIAIALEISLEDLKKITADENHPISRAIRKGKLEQKIILGKKIVQLAKQGSGPAQTLVEKLIRNTEIDNLLDHYGESEKFIRKN